VIPRRSLQRRRPLRLRLRRRLLKHSATEEMGNGLSFRTDRAASSASPSPGLDVFPFRPRPTPHFPRVIPTRTSPELTTSPQRSKPKLVDFLPGLPHFRWLRALRTRSNLWACAGAAAASAEDAAGAAGAAAASAEDAAAAAAAEAAGAAQRRKRRSRGPAGNRGAGAAAASAEDNLAAASAEYESATAAGEAAAAARWGGGRPAAVTAGEG